MDRLQGEVPAVLLGADPDQLRPEHLPQLPAWWPADPKPTEDVPHPHPLQPVQRTAARQHLAQQEAMRGPMDGLRVLVGCWAGTPPTSLPVMDGGWQYALDEPNSSPQLLRYRYSPAASPQHGPTMRAVEQAYAEVGGPQYVDESRADGPAHQGITMERTG